MPGTGSVVLRGFKSASQAVAVRLVYLIFLVLAIAGAASFL
jgi:hypothetical protein